MHVLIVNKYREGNLKKTLKRELDEVEMCARNFGYIHYTENWDVQFR